MAILVLTIVNVNVSNIAIGNVGPEKKDAYQEGLMVADWAQLKKQNKKRSLPGISKQTQAHTNLPVSHKELPACSVFLPSELTLTKRNPVRLRLFLSNLTYTTIYSLASSLANQNGSILSNQDSAFCSKLQGFRVLICMKIDQSGSRSRGFCLFKTIFPLVWRVHFSFTLKAEACISLAGAGTPNTLARVKQSEAKWSRAELYSQTGALPKGHLSEGHLASVLFSQLCGITIELYVLNKDSFFTAP